MKYNPYPYQQHATDHVIKFFGAGLFMDMGLGKTVATLTAIQMLLFDLFEAKKILVIAPKRVAQSVWSDEIAKWDHLKDLKLSKILGTEKQRKMAMKEKADIYIVNRENLCWLIGQYGTAFPYDMVVIDELSSFKNSDTKRFKAFKRIRPKVNRLIGLTGTPAPNSLLDLWSELYLLDSGQRLGQTITAYREGYFTKLYQGGYKIRDKKCQQQVFDKISDICISMKASDYLDLPGRLNRTVNVHFSKSIQHKYEEFEELQVLKLLNSEEISAVNAGALTTKLLQFANGAVYREDGTYVEVHEEKLEALEEIIDTANGHPVLVAYSYRHDRERILKYLKKIRVHELKKQQDIENWNQGLYSVMITHPASAGHGLNLQAGGNIIVWFGPIWSLELYDQFNARLDRQGQKSVVIIHHLIAKGTMDEDAMRSLSDKSSGQQALMDAVKVRIEKYTKRIAI